MVEQSKPALQEDMVSGSSPDAGTKHTKMEWFNGIICVTVAELTDDSDAYAVMTRSNYDMQVYRKRIHVVRPGKGQGNYALIDWASLQQCVKDRYIAKYGDREKDLRRAANELVTDTAAFDFFSTEDLALKEDKINEYTLNASVLNRLIYRRKDQKAMRGLGGNNTPINWTGIVNESEMLRGEYGHTLPKSESRLRDKIRQYEKEGYACLISGKLGNANTTKITGEGAEAIIAMKRSHFPRYTNTQIFERYNSIAEENGWKPLKSATTLVSFLNRPEVRSQWIGGAHGELYSKKTLSRRHTTVLPQVRDAIWYGDGTKLNLYYKAFVNGSWQPATLCVFEVVDAYSEVFLGYGVGTNENFDMMYEAYRSSIEFAGHCPVELVYDNQGGSRTANATDWFPKLARLARPCTPQNPTSKTIEAIFGRFQAEVLYQRWNYSGGNITAKTIDARVDLDRIIANKDDLPTYDELMKIYIEARQEWNNALHPKYKRPRMELYLSSVNAESQVLSPAMSRELFWLTSKNAVTFTPDGLKIQIKGETHIYEVYNGDLPDLDWCANNVGRKFFVQYDPHDMSTVRFCTKDDYGLQFVTEAKYKRIIPRALQDQTEDDRSFIRRMEEAGKQKQVDMYLDGVELDRKYGQSFEQHGLRDPKLPGIRPKEFERYAQNWAARREPAPMEVLPDSIGKVEKQISNMDELQRNLSRADRM